MPTYRLKVSGDIPSQVTFWGDSSRLRGYVGGIGSGKTFAGAVEAIRQPAGTTGLVVAPTYGMMRDASQSLFFDLFEHFVADHNKSTQTTELIDGKRILWRGADRPKSLRGPNIHWGWGDEWSFVSEEAHRVAMGRIRLDPARWWFTTTPNGQNWLYETCVLRQELGWSLHFGSTLDNPHLAASYRESIQLQYADDPLFAAQELEGQFVDLSGSKRHPALLVAAVYEDASPLTSHRLAVAGARVYVTPVSGKRYVIGADPAEGIPGADDSAAVVLAVDTGEVVAVLAGELEPTEAFPAALASLSRYYNNAAIMVERNNHGHAVLGGLRRLRRGPLLYGDDGKAGWRTTARSKADLHRALHSLCLDARDAGRPVLRDQVLRDQIKAIDRDTLAAPGKRKGVTKVDDLATAAALAARGLEKVHGTPQVPEIDVKPIIRPPAAGDW